MEQNLTGMMRQSAEYRALARILQKKRWYRSALRFYKWLLQLKGGRG